MDFRMHGATIKKRTTYILIKIRIIPQKRDKACEREIL
jgi:hypothetical protein